MNELLAPESTELSSEGDSVLNSLLLQLGAAADNLHAVLVVWESHIDHPGARTAIHSAARALLDAASAMPTHYDDAEVRAQALREAADEAERHANEGCPSCSNNPVSACSGANNLTAAWLRSRAEQTKEDR